MIGDGRQKRRRRRRVNLFEAEKRVLPRALSLSNSLQG